MIIQKEEDEKYKAEVNNYLGNKGSRKKKQGINQVKFRVSVISREQNLL